MKHNGCETAGGKYTPPIKDRNAPKHGDQFTYYVPGYPERQVDTLVRKGGRSMVITTRRGRSTRWYNLGVELDSSHPDRRR